MIHLHKEQIYTRISKAFISNQTREKNYILIPFSSDTSKF